MASLLDQLETVVNEFAASWTEEEKALAKAVVKDYADLTVRALTGENVTSEMAEVRMQAGNIVIAATISFSQSVEDKIRQVITDLLKDLLPII